MSRTWYNTGRPVRFFGVDGRAFLFLLLLIYRVNWWTFGIAVFGITILVFLDRRSYSIPNALRRIRVFIMGNHRPAVLNRRRGRSDR